MKKHFDIPIMIMLMSSTVLAHPGPAGHVHEVQGFLPGFLHPLLGVDHLITAIAVGVWATVLGRKALLAFPVTFILAMAFGAFAGIEGLSLPFKESGILLSMALLGLALVFSVRMPLLLALPILVSFGIFHGNAHGSEMGSEFSALSFSIGFILATTCLHLVGIASVGFLNRIWNESFANVGVRIFGTVTLASVAYVWLS